MTQETSPNILIIFVGTSGSGRKTISNLVAKELGLHRIMSWTTRHPRRREENGKEYNFVTMREFRDINQSGGFFQTVCVDNDWYGTKKTDIYEALGTHAVSYMVLNREGAERFKRQYGDRVIRIFLYVSKQEILERLYTKGYEGSVIDHYIDHYADEVSYRRQCEYVFENVDLYSTVDRVREVIQSHMPRPAESDEESSAEQLAATTDAGTASQGESQSTVTQ